MHSIQHKLCTAMIGCALFAFHCDIIRADPLFFPSNGHYYDFIAESFTWQNARADASARTYRGGQGYLSTLTSAEEDQFIRTNFSTQVNQYVGPWLGASWDGSGPGATFGWTWVTGEPFVYTGWNSGEPNHLGGENALHFSGGGWNDIHLGRTDTIGYFIEFNPIGTVVAEPTGNLFFYVSAGFLLAASRILKTKKK